MQLTTLSIFLLRLLKNERTINDHHNKCFPIKHSNSTIAVTVTDSSEEDKFFHLTHRWNSSWRGKISLK